ncbi:MAG: hypothetical protein AAGJ81_01605 [Verrucomicrobiota bacterium]
MHPRPCKWRIAWENNEEICVAKTDFSNVGSLGAPGMVESPLAYDPNTNLLYRYYCPSLATRNQVNGVIAINLSSGEREMCFTLNPLRTVPWMLQKIPDKPFLVGLVVTDASRTEKPGIVLQHQLGLFDLDQKKSLLRALPNGCQHPVTASPASDRLLFHGPDGFQQVSLRGRRRLTLSGSDWGDGRDGAAFHPRNSSIVVGGPSLSLFEPLRRRRTEWVKSGGGFPVWNEDASTLFFSENSGSLSRYNPASEVAESIVSIPANRHPERKKSRPVALSEDQRYFALPLTRRSPFHAETSNSDQPAWIEHQTLVIGDLENQEIWQFPGPVNQCIWVKS